MSTLKSSAENLTLNADGSGNDIKFQSNAVEKASISDAGLLTTSGGASLDGAVTINDTGADVDFRVESDNDANAFFVQGSNGNVGIGIGAPIAPLESAITTGGGYGESNFLATCFSATDAHGACLTFRKSSSSTLGTHAATTSGDCLGVIQFSGSDDGNAWEDGSWIRAFQTGTGVASGLPSNLKFHTSNPGGDGASQERLEITHDGRGLSQFTAKGWANWDQTGTLNIRDSHNISGMVDNGTGETRVNWDVDLGNAHYSATIASQDTTSNHNVHQTIEAQAAGTLRLSHMEGSTPALVDCQKIMVTAFGD